MLKQCCRVSGAKANILLIGESGSGKEVAARHIHACGPRCNKNFVPVNCSALTESLLEAELFGYEQGSFTGAVRAKAGKFELSHEGTLFLDEIGDTNLQTQPKLLRVLETKKTERVGSNEERHIDFRLISATNTNLISKVHSESCREDFFYRISTIVIEVPPLRERGADLPDLIDWFLKRSQKENNVVIREIEPAVRDFLLQYDYPGNVRELKSIIERMVVLSEDGVITGDGIPVLYDLKRESAPQTARLPIPLKEFRRRTESEYIDWVIQEYKGDLNAAAGKLGISRRHLDNKIHDYHLDTGRK